MNQARRYSERLGILSPAQFQAALDRFDLGRLLAAEPIHFGNFGQNVFVTSTAGEFVLRGAPHLPWQFPTEQFFAGQLHKRTSAPVPWPYRIDPSEAIFGWSYVLMPRMPGLQLADPAVRAGLNKTDRLGIARALAENLVRMQELTWPLCGRYDLSASAVLPFDLRQELAWPLVPEPDGGAGVFDVAPPAYADVAVSRIRHRLLQAQQYSQRTTEEDIAWTEAIIAEARAALDEPFEPCFVMEDYKRDNLTVDATEDGWRVSGVFDLMQAHFADGEADCCRIIAMYLDEEPDLAGEFLRTYLARRPPRPGFAQRFPVYMLQDRTIIWEYAKRAGRNWWPEHLLFREWAGRYLSFGGTLAT